MAAIFLIILWLNWNSHTMLAVYAYYIDFKNIILSGFNASQAKLCNPTFPMWGYGWLLIITENKLLLILIQGSLAIFSVWYFFRMAQSNNMLDDNTLLIYKTLLIIAIPFYAFHSIRWPYSISMSLIVLSLVLFLAGFFYIKKPLKRIIISGILFGLALNFRSDYYLIPIGFSIVMLIIMKFRSTVIGKTAVWLIAIYAMLIPWGMYTYYTTGHFLLTSTNKGHVMFIGLGNLPDNKWGITKWDHDPVLKATMIKEYGEDKSTLLYETNQYVLSEFKNRIKADPTEYVRKNIYAAGRLFLEGVYSGDFLHHEVYKLQPLDTCWTRPGDTWKFNEGENTFKGIRSEFLNKPLQTIKHIGFTSLLRIMAKKISSAFSRITSFLALILLPLGLFFSIRDKNYLMLFSILLILYQAGVNILAYQWNLYTANVYFFLLLLLSYTLLSMIYLVHKKKETEHI